MIRFNEIIKDQLIALVCDFLRLPCEMVFSKCRDKELCEAREMICYLLRKHTSLSQSEVAQIIGFGSHASVWRAVKLIGDFLEVDKKYAQRFEELLSKAKEIAEQAENKDKTKLNPGDICWFWNDSWYYSDSKIRRLPVLGTFEKEHFNEENATKYISREYPALEYSCCEFAGEMILPAKFRIYMRDHYFLASELADKPTSPNRCLI